MRFNPDDPTVWLWRRLMRKKPYKLGKKPRTRAEKTAMSKKIRNYYVEHQHPHKDRQPGKD